MKKILAALCGVLGMLAAAGAIFLSFRFQNADPILLGQPEAARQCVTSLMDALCTGDYAGAEDLLYGSPDLGLGREPESEVGGLIWDAFTESLRCELSGELYATNNGVAQDVYVTGLDIAGVMEELGRHARALLEQRVAQAEAVSEVYDENNEYRKDFVMAVLSDAASDILAKSPAETEHLVTVNLVYEDDRWQAVPGSAFLETISGNVLRIGSSTDAAIMDRFDMYMTNGISTALEGVLAVEKVYWLRDEDPVAPEPNLACYGQTDDPASLQWLLDASANLLDGQELLFSTDIPIKKGTTINYYLDDTILVITWKQLINNRVYTISEVKIAHASQFRRFLAGGVYGSDKQFVTTEMAQSVNAVVASSGDFYKNRRQGIIVYEGEVKRVDGKYVDTCCVDDNGDLIFIGAGEITDMETAQAFVEENNIRFSLAFGPILVENGVRCEPDSYALGQINEDYARAALAQMDKLHYLLVTINAEGIYLKAADVHELAGTMERFGCEMAYTLDGGQTAVIAMNGEAMNHVLFGYQRRISDIIYFATAVPDGG